MKKLLLILSLLLIGTNAYAGDGHGHAFANIIIFLTIAILGYFIFGVKKLLEFIKNKKELLQFPIFTMNKNSLDITFTSIQNRKFRVIDLIFSRKILFSALLFHVIFVGTFSKYYLEKNGIDFLGQFHLYIFDIRTVLLLLLSFLLFSYLYFVSQVHLINSSFLISKRYGRFQILLPIFLLFLAFFNLIPLNKIGMVFYNSNIVESFLNAIFIMPFIVIVLNLIQSSLIYIFKND